MTAQKLLETLKFIDSLDKKLKLQTILEAIKNALSDLVNAPANPNHQATLAGAMAEFRTAAGKLQGLLVPGQLAAIAEMGGEGFFDGSIAAQVTDSIQSNAMTPSVARDFVQNLSNRRATFLDVVRSTIQGLERLNIRESQVAPGTADLAFVIPRDLFDNHLDEFAKELKFIDKLLRDFNEALGTHPEPIQLKELSSSTPTVAVAAGILVVSTIGTVVNKFLNAWKTLEEIREIRTKLKNLGRTAPNTEKELDETITTVIEEVVVESTTIVLTKYDNDASRKNELNTAITQDMRRLFGQIERGLTIEFRATPKQDANEDEQRALENVTKLKSEIQFPPIPKDPLLLSSEEVLEGDIHGRTVSKKTTKTTTTTRKFKPELQRD